MGTKTKKTLATTPVSPDEARKTNSLVAHSLVLRQLKLPCTGSVHVVKQRARKNVPNHNRQEQRDVVRHHDWSTTITIVSG